MTAPAGKYIVIEGADGTGKSTQVELLQQRLKDAYGIEAIQVHEPDGFVGDRRLGIAAVPGAAELRKIIKNGRIPRDPWTNVMLFTAARRLNWQQAMEPALDRGIWVLAARSYISTIAYQGYGEGVDRDRIVAFTRDNVGERYLKPDLQIILTLESENLRAERLDGRGQPNQPDTFESKPAAFQAAMQAGYLSFAAENGLPVIDAARSPAAVRRDIEQRLQALL